MDSCYGCGVVGFDSIGCVKCWKWIHRCCSDLPRWGVYSVSCQNVFFCRTCLGLIYSENKETVDLKGPYNVAEEVEKFS